jgi:hypothetical protein
MLTRVLGRTPYYVVVGGLAVMFLFPLVWNTWASVSEQPGTAQESGYGFGNYRTLLDYDAGLWRYLLNSTLVSALTVALTLGVSLLGGYAFARFRFPGRNLLFLLTLAILMVPYATLLFLAAWNDFIAPLILISDSEKGTPAAGNFTAAVEGRLQQDRRGREFADSDVYKLLEALAWETGYDVDPALIETIAAAQEPDRLPEHRLRPPRPAVSLQRPRMGSRAVPRRPPAGPPTTCAPPSARVASRASAGTR